MLTFSGSYQGSISDTFTPFLLTKGNVPSTLLYMWFPLLLVNYFSTSIVVFNVGCYKLLLSILFPITFGVDVTLLKAYIPMYGLECMDETRWAWNMSVFYEAQKKTFWFIRNVCFTRLRFNVTVLYRRWSVPSWFLDWNWSWLW